MSKPIGFFPHPSVGIKMTPPMVLISSLGEHVSLEVAWNLVSDGFSGRKLT